MKTHFNIIKKAVIATCLLILSSAQAINAQSFTITGTIYDNSGVPIFGATVQEDANGGGTITNEDGQFTLEVTSEQTKLTFSYIGMESQVHVVGKVRDFQVTLKSDNVKLDELVVVGYTTQRKKDITGAVSVVDVDEMIKQGENNPIKALQGRVPGVNISSDGSPSGASTVRIRGIGTLNNNDPLYVIDGVATKGGMHELNPSDIENIQILRDAASASIYGCRAANGVIIITTKKGKEGKTKINFDSFFSSSQYGEVIDMLNIKEFGAVQWEAMMNSGTDPNSNQIGYVYDYSYDNEGYPMLNSMSLPKYIDARDGTNAMLTGDTDWFDEITKTGFTQSYNLSVSNSSEKSNSFFSLGYYDNNGTVKHTNYKRFSSRINTSYKLFGDLITIGENITFNKTHELQMPGGVLNLAIQSLPVMPVHTQDGDWGYVTSGMNDRDNPARILDANKNNPYDYWRIFGNAYINIQPIKNLNIKSNFGIDNSNYFQRALTTSFTGRLGSDLTSSKLIQSHYQKFTWTNTANYSFDVKDNHFSVLIGNEIVKHSDINFSAEKRSYEVEDPDYMWPNAGVGEAFATGGATGSVLNSYFGKVNYTYGDKYLASATIRRDGSSRFGKNNRYATFPAFTAGWRINQESFMNFAKSYMSDLKLRVSYGLTGNQEIDNYAIRTLIVTNYVGDTWAGINSGTAYDIKGNNSGLLASGYQMTQRSNDDLRWETTKQINVGLDFGFFNQNLYGSAEWYKKMTDDILIVPPYLAAIGEGGNHWVNGASMENVGVELALGYRAKTDFDFSYDIAANISGYRNKITMLPESVVNSYGGNGTTDNILGRPVNSTYGYVADGLFQSQEEVDAHGEQTGKGIGRIRYKDLNHDNIIDENDRDWICNPHPKFEYGLNLVLAWKGIDLTAFIQGVYGNQVYNSVKMLTDFWSVSELGANKSSRLLDAWSTSNTDSDIPALAYTDLNNEKRTSSYYVEDGSYCKLKNLQLGYTLPEELLSRLKVSKMRIYISGQNLYTIKSKEFTGLDPENPYLAYPNSKIYTVGLNMSF